MPVKRGKQFDKSSSPAAQAKKSASPKASANKSNAAPSPKKKEATPLPKMTSNVSMSGGSPKKQKAISPEQARLEIQASIRFANDRTNEFTDFVRSFRGDTFDKLVDNLVNAQNRISDSLKKCRNADGGMKDKDYELLVDNTLRDMRTAVTSAKELKTSVLKADEFKKCEQGALHARDQLFQLIRKAKPTQELSPVVKESSPLHESMGKTNASNPFNMNSSIRKENAKIPSKKEIAVASGREPTMFAADTRNAGPKMYNAHAKQQQAKSSGASKQKQQAASKQAPNSVKGGLLLQKLGNNNNNVPVKTAPTPQKTKTAAPPQPQPKKAKGGKGGNRLGNPKDLLNKRNIFLCRDARGDQYKCVLLGATYSGFKVSVFLKNGVTLRNIIVQGRDLKPAIPQGMVIPMAPPSAELGAVDPQFYNQRGFYECSDKRGIFYECVVRGRVQNQFKCSVITTTGTTLQNALVNPWDIRSLGTKCLTAPVDWSLGGVPTRTKPVLVQDTQEMQMDWSVRGLPKSMRGADWSAYYNKFYQRTQMPGPRLIVDWSNAGLPVSIGNEMGARWALGAWEYMRDTPSLVCDWNANGLPASFSGDAKWVKKAQKNVNEEIFCDWSCAALPMKIDNVIWASSFCGVQRGMMTNKFRNAGQDKCRLIMDWNAKGMPLEAEGQSWTKFIGGPLAERVRLLRHMNKQLQKQLGSPLNPKKAIPAKNYYTFDALSKNACKDYVEQTDIFLNKSKIRGAEGAQLAERMTDVKRVNRRAMLQQYKENRTNKNRKALNKWMYTHRMKDLGHQLQEKRLLKKYLRRRAREEKIQMRSGLRYEEMPAETLYVHKHGPRSNPNRPNSFVYGTRDRYEAQDLKGRWWDCVVNTCLGDGNYIISIPCADGVTFSNCLANHSQIRPHMLHNVKGLYEAVDEEGVCWDVIVNEHLAKGHININVVTQDGTQYEELKTHWSQVRLKIHLNVGQLYEAMDRQGHHWPIIVTRRLPGNMFCFNCMYGDEVIENLKCHHNDIRLIDQSKKMSMSPEEMQKSGLMPKQPRQQNRLLVPQSAGFAEPSRMRMPAAPPMPTMAPPTLSSSGKGGKGKKGNKNRKGQKRKAQDNDEQDPASHEIALNSVAWHNAAHASKKPGQSWVNDNTWMVVMDSGKAKGKGAKNQAAPQPQPQQAKGKGKAAKKQQQQAPPAPTPPSPKQKQKQKQKQAMKSMKASPSMASTVASASNLQSLSGIYRSAPVQRFVTPLRQWRFVGRNTKKFLREQQAMAQLRDTMLMKALNTRPGPGKRGSYPEKAKSLTHLRDNTWMAYFTAPPKATTPSKKSPAAQKKGAGSTKPSQNPHANDPSHHLAAHHKMHPGVSTHQPKPQQANQQSDSSRKNINRKKK